MSMRFANGHIFFWGEWPSNWTPSPFVLDGVQYNCVEQYMMAEKARLFGDTQTLSRIMATSDPRDQKRYGRQVVGFDSDKWSEVCYNVVLKATIEKYRQNPDLRELLFSTGEDIFVEASPHDVIWGIGMGKTDLGVEDPKNWKGQNLLGKAITEARRILREQGQ